MGQVTSPALAAPLRTQRVLRMDWVLAVAVLALGLWGMIFVYSAASRGGLAGGLLLRQALAWGLGLGLMGALALFPYNLFETYARPVYLWSVAVLMSVLIIGTRLRGSRSWFHFFFFYLQPVEFTRLALIIGLAAYCVRKEPELERWPGMIGPLLLTMVHLGLILLQPDLSSSLSLGPITLAMVYAAGAPLGALLAWMSAAALAVGVPLATTYFQYASGAENWNGLERFFQRVFLEPGMFVFFWFGVAVCLGLGWWFLRRLRFRVSGASLLVSLLVLGGGLGGSFVIKHAIKPYQQKRLVAFLDPSIDPQGSGYNIIQSQIALGSGRLFGKGYLAGSQSQLGFLPEKHTDFIFSLVGEETGWWGASLLLGLYFWVVWRALDIASAARDLFGRLVAVGVAVHFGFSGLVNLGMVMGLMPVTGVPLPFISYGGSGLLGSYAGVGLLLSIHLRRHLL